MIVIPYLLAPVLIIGGLWLLSELEPHVIHASQKKPRLYPLWVERLRRRNAQKKLDRLIREAKQKIEAEEAQWKADSKIYYQYRYPER